MQTNQRNHNYQDRSGEQGVALLLTLGIVSLLLMLALSFALTARTDRQAASVNADMIKARLLAESGLERVLGLLRHGHDNDLYPGTGPFFSTGPAGTDWEDHWYLVSLGTDDDEGLAGRAMSIRFSTENPSRSLQYTPDAIPAGSNASWHHILDDNDELLGRIAFLAIDESGKIDPNLASWERELDDWLDNNPTLADEDHPEWFNHLHPIFWAHSRSNYVFENLDLSPGHPSINRWFSWFQLIGIMPDNPALIRTLSHRLFPWSYAVEEWHDGGSERPRYNLRHDDWDNYDSRSDVNTIKTAIPWLNQLESTAAGISNSIIQNQVAANLIAYSSAVGTDPPTDLEIEGDDWEDWPIANRTAWPAGGYSGWPVDPSQPDPSVTYIGRKAVPYINEVAIDVELGYSDTSELFGLTFKVTPELLNIYEDSRTTCSLTLLLKFDNIPAAASPPTPSGVLRGASRHGVVLHWSPITVDNNDYATASEQTFTYGIAPAAIDVDGIPTPLNIAGFRVTAFAVVRDTTGQIADDAADMGSSPPVDLAANISTDSATSINFRALDPRANTIDEHWQVSGSHSLGTRNPGANPSTGDDLEVVTDPADGVSTAFIRNAPIENLWELGAIHRGEPWQTLNLTAFNDGSADPRTWTYGDAAILDQVKLTDQDISYYRVNINTPYEEVLRSLLEQVVVGADGYQFAYLTPGGTAYPPGNLINPGSPATIAAAQAILDLNRTNDPAVGPLVSRGEIAAVTELTDGSIISQDTQREREEIIGKIAHLLTTRQNFFRIVVTAQVLQDLGISPPTHVQGERNVIEVELSGIADRWGRIQSEQKIMAIVYRDAFTNHYRILRYEYLED